MDRKLNFSRISRRSRYRTGEPCAPYWNCLEQEIYNIAGNFPSRSQHQLGGAPQYCARQRTSQCFVNNSISQEWICQSGTPFTFLRNHGSQSQPPSLQRPNVRDHASKDQNNHRRTPAHPDGICISAVQDPPLHHLRRGIDMLPKFLPFSVRHRLPLK